MKISRYIKFPLIFAILFFFYLYLFRFDSTLNQLAISLTLGATIGIALQFYNDYKTRQIKPDAVEKEFATKQNQTLSVLCNSDEAFNLSLESVAYLKRGKVTAADIESGFIQVKTGINWNSFGNIVEFKIRTITENATEVEISTRPILGTTLIDYGESVKIFETIRKYFAKKNEQSAYKLLESKFEIPIDFKVNEFNRENITDRKRRSGTNE